MSELTEKIQKETEWNKETMRDFVRSIEKTIGGRR